MDLIVQPVKAIKPGVVMHPPIVLALKAPAKYAGNLVRALPAEEFDLAQRISEEVQSSLEARQ